MRLMTALLALVITLVASPAVAVAQPFPDIIQLPNGFRPEGIAIRGTTFYTGSLSGATDKGVYRGDIRTGERSQLIPGNGGPFVGMKVDDRGRLWIAGGPTGRGYAYNATTGALLRTFQFATTAPTFVNDVIVTKDAAWFTESMAPRLYRVAIGPGGAIGAATTVDLTGKIEVVPGFNLNGIAATPDGSTLIVVNSSSGKLYTIDTETIATHQIDLGGATVTTGDGILLHGRTLYVVRNTMNRIAVIELTPDLSSGTIVGVITNPAFDVPTTIARHGSALYAVNARFGTPSPNTATYTAVRVER